MLIIPSAIRFEHNVFPALLNYSIVPSPHPSNLMRFRIHFQRAYHSTSSQQDRWYLWQSWKLRIIKRISFLRTFIQFAITFSFNILLLIRYMLLPRTFEQSLSFHFIFLNYHRRSINIRST